MIENVQIAVNRYAPEGTEAINMYSMDGGDPLTFGQIMAAVCIRSGANREARSVIKMNIMNPNVEKIETTSNYMSEIAANSVTSGWDNIKNYLVNTLGIDTSALPGNLNSYDNRNLAIKAIKEKLEELTRQAQEDMIDLQSLVNERDNCYTTGTNLIKSSGQSALRVASNLY
ncbi:MAG: hypothetical protein J5746_11035 [Victivallales bacterium]|nr:hypothetical protein [Victivallales bacterium]